MTSVHKSEKFRPDVCRNYKRRAFAALTLVVFVLVGFYVVAPIMIQRHLNEQVLADMGEYTGQVNDVSLNLTALGYVLHDMRIVRKNGQQDTPFFSVNQLAISINVKSAMNGHLDVNASLFGAELHFIDSPSQPKKQVGKGPNWLNIFRNVLPTTVNTISLRDGTIRFTNNDTSPKVDLVSHQISAELRNLSSAQASDERRSATGYYRSKVEQSGQFFAKAKFDPNHFDDFHLQATSKNLRLKEFNDFFEAYANIDFEDGHGDVLIELSANREQLDGYIKPFIHDIQIVSWQQDVAEQHDNPFKLVWEASLDIMQNIITTLGTDELATKIELSGSISRTQVQSWPAFGEALKNMLLNSVTKQFDITGDNDNDG